jgi:hypothetical protein
VGDRDHREGQLRVLGSPSARHTKEPRTGGPPGGRAGGGSAGPIFFLRKSLRTYRRRPPEPHQPRAAEHLVLSAYSENWRIHSFRPLPTDYAVWSRFLAPNPAAHMLHSLDLPAARALTWAALT